MVMNSSASRAGVVNNAKDFEVGYGMLPYYADVKGAPQNSIIGGATLWVLKGHDAEEYKGVADFFRYLSSAEVQADWHQFSGYLPITQAAYDLGKKQGYYEKNPGTDVGIKEITLNQPTPNSRACASATTSRSARSSTRNSRLCLAARSLPRKHLMPLSSVATS